jgi:AraC-like DNA-binding protein
MEFWEHIQTDEAAEINLSARRSPVVIFVMSGAVSVYSDSRKTDLSRGSMTVFSAKESVGISTGAKSSVIVCEFPVITFFSDAKLVQELLPLVDDCKKNEKILPIKKTILQFLLLLIHYMKYGLFSDYLSEIKRKELFLLICACYKKNEIANFFSDFLSKDVHFKQFVIDNYGRVKSVNELALLANSSTSGFMKKFRKTFNESPYRWLQKQKARNILDDINSGKKSLQELAIEYKFSSYQHFVLFCKKYFNATPTAIYGKNLLEK